MIPELSAYLDGIGHVQLMDLSLKDPDLLSKVVGDINCMLLTEQEMHMEEILAQGPVLPTKSAPATRGVDSDPNITARIHQAITKFLGSSGSLGDKED